MIMIDIIKDEEHVDEIIFGNHSIVSFESSESLYDQAIKGEYLVAGWVEDTKVYGKILDKHRYPREKCAPISVGGVKCDIEYTWYIVFELMVDREIVYWKPSDGITECDDLRRNEG